MNELRVALVRYLDHLAKEHSEEPNLEICLAYEEKVIADFLSWAEQNS